MQPNIRRRNTDTARGCTLPAPLTGDSAWTSLPFLHGIFGHALDADFVWKRGEAVLPSPVWGESSWSSKDVLGQIHATITRKPSKGAAHWSYGSWTDEAVPLSILQLSPARPVVSAIVQTLRDCSVDEMLDRIAAIDIGGDHNRAVVQWVALAICLVRLFDTPASEQLLFEGGKLLKARYKALIKGKRRSL
ncbi:hypothetical protein IAU60_005883 [Kwoniella sp. DSM 27419]